MEVAPLEIMEEGSLDNVSFLPPENVEVGTRFKTLYDLKRSGIHSSCQRFQVKNKLISSLILSSMDVDEGENIKVTFHENSNKTSRLTSDHFHKNMISGVPIRVVRSPKLGGQYSPLINYRYDGLYEVMYIDFSNLPNGIKRYEVDLTFVHEGQTAPWQELPIPSPDSDGDEPSPVPVPAAVVAHPALEKLQPSPDSDRDEPVHVPVASSSISSAHHGEASAALLTRMLKEQQCPFEHKSR